MITVYTRTTCAQCVPVKKYLTMKNVEFEVINLDLPEHQEVMRKLDKMGFRNVPITSNSEKPANKWVTGLNIGKIAELIK